MFGCIWMHILINLQPGSAMGGPLSCKCTTDWQPYFPGVQIGIWNLRVFMESQISPYTNFEASLIMPFKKVVSLIYTQIFDWKSDIWGSGEENPSDLRFTPSPKAPFWEFLVLLYEQGSFETIHISEVHAICTGHLVQIWGLKLQCSKISISVPPMVQTTHSNCSIMIQSMDLLNIMSLPMGTQQLCRQLEKNLRSEI